MTRRATNPRNVPKVARCQPREHDFTETVTCIGRNPIIFCRKCGEMRHLNLEPQQQP